jgi:hypothetical protein
MGMTAIDPVASVRGATPPHDGWSGADGSFDFTGHVRDVSDDEAAFFKLNGWVKLEGLVSEALADELFSRAQAIMGATANRTTVSGQGDPAFEEFHAVLRNFLRPSQRDPLMWALSHSPLMGRVASRMMRDAPVKILNDELLVKPPAAEGGKPTPWHQDLPHASFDRWALKPIWLALTDIPYEKSTMRFLSKSHQAGPMGRTLLQDDDLVTQRPDLLEEYELSPILNMAKGDATVHHDLLVHSAPPNNTSDPRWSYLLNFFDASARYAGGPSYGEPLSHLTVNELFPEQTYPTIYPQQT